VHRFHVLDEVGIATCFGDRGLGELARRLLGIAVGAEQRIVLVGLGVDPETHVRDW
jgi:hypothetical protein